MFTNKQKTVLILVGIASFIPIWRSGGRKNLTFWQFVLNHTVMGPPVEYVPEEDYTRALSRKY